MDEHLLRLSYLFLTLSEDLHEHLGPSNWVLYVCMYICLKVCVIPVA